MLLMLFCFCLPWLIVLLIGTMGLDGFLTWLGGMAAIMPICIIGIWRQESRWIDAMLAEAARRRAAVAPRASRMWRPVIRYRLVTSRHLPGTP